MSVSQVNGVDSFATQEIVNNGTTKNTGVSTNSVKAETKTNQDVAATFEKSNTKVIGKKDTVTIERLKAEAEEKTAQLRSLVEKMLVKQGKTYNNSTDFYQLLRQGKLEVDPEVSAQAKKDIAEDGYWGVEQTSERLVSFAKALAGNDPEKADEMIEAVEKGFKQATKAWGDELPDICKQTLDATKEKLNKWKAEIE